MPGADPDFDARHPSACPSDHPSCHPSCHPSAARLLSALVREVSVTPAPARSFDGLASLLQSHDFRIMRPRFQAEGTQGVDNLLATHGTAGPHLVFAGHMDVVPPGDDTLWQHPPFSGTLEAGVVHGRGTVDMKGAIAAFVAAFLAFKKQAGGTVPGTVSLMIAGDEEGPAINGTKPLLDYARAQGLAFDGCLLGEPTSSRQVGDTIKIGRRGSLSGTLTIHGTQGHVAYPHLADNPVPGLAAAMRILNDLKLDAGSRNFAPSNLEITGLTSATDLANVIPQSASLRFNIRFNDHWTGPALQARLHDVLAACPDIAGRFALDFRTPVAECFHAPGGPLAQIMSRAVFDVTSRHAQLSTSGGTSDARFIFSHCPVIECGLVGKRMHQIDEQVPVRELDMLVAIYTRFLGLYFAPEAGPEAGDAVKR